MATTRKSTTTAKEKVETSADVLALLEEINKLKAELKNTEKISFTDTSKSNGKSNSNTKKI